MDAGIIVKSEIFLLTGIETGFFFFFRELCVRRGPALARLGE